MNKQKVFNVGFIAIVLVSIIMAAVLYVDMMNVSPLLGVGVGVGLIFIGTVLILWEPGEKSA